MYFKEMFLIFNSLVVLSESDLNFHLDLAGPASQVCAGCLDSRTTGYGYRSFMAQKICLSFRLLFLSGAGGGGGVVLLLVLLEASWYN